MFKNHLKVALRYLFQHKGYSLINIAGLAVGMACCILILLWVRDEISYDRFHENAENLYRINSRDSENPEGIIVSSSFAVAPKLKALFPEIALYSRFWYYGSMVEFRHKRFRTHNRFCIVDPAFFQMFSFPFLKGDPAKALRDRHSVVITQETARKIFGHEDPMGKLLKIDDEKDFTVTGVIKDVPPNSHLQFDYLSHIELMPRERLENFESVGPSYVLLRKGVSVPRFNKKIADFYLRFDPDTTWQPYLQRFTDIHLNRWGLPGRIKYVYIFSIIALFVLVIACINFMNLSTARSLPRAKEIGIRKVVGAKRNDIIKQFFGESVLLSFISLLFALMLVEFLIPLFNTLTGKDLKLFFPGNISILLGGVVIALLTGIIAGSYPALFLSALHPSKIFRRKWDHGAGSSSFRTVLVVIQFSISVGLIIGTIIIYSQLNYIKNRGLGFDKDFIVSISENPVLLRKFNDFRNELLKSTDILSVTAASTLPSDVGQTMEINWRGNTAKKGISMSYAMVDHDFIKTFNMKLAEGRDFSRDFSTDTTEAYIINETAAGLMKINSPPGKEIYFDSSSGRYYHKGKIIGVVKDFHFKSLHREIGPFVMRIYPPWFSKIFVRIKPGHAASSVHHIKRVVEQMAAGYPFEFSFLDEEVNEMYRSERQMGTIINSLAVLAIFISCLGLFGLSTFLAEQRSKEIGIRKAMGSSIPGVITLFSRSFARWILIANMIAWPLAYFAMSRWLQNFAYRININPLAFILSAVITLGVAMITVGYQSVKAAVADPVKALRYE